MRSVILILAVLFSLTLKGQVHVNGYYRSNGTYVAPYTRSSPNSSPYDNYSFPGNTNPYTGKVATGNPDTYIENLYNKNSISSSDVWVEGYYRSDGTWVNGHYRSAPNGNPYDNYSFPGNTNPYTGKTATGNPDTYLNNYNNGSSHNYGATYYVSSHTLNIRSGPSTSYSILTTLNYGESVVILGSANSSWTEIKASYYEGSSWKSTIGYVYNYYLSASTPMPSYSANNSSNYSSQNSQHPYGHDNGKISIWTNCSDDGIILVYIDGVYRGQVVPYYNNVAPDCGDSNTLGIALPKGMYKLTAIGSRKHWEVYITITADQCSTQKLSK